MLTETEQAKLRALHLRLPPLEYGRVMTVGSLIQFIDQLKTSQIIDKDTVFINLSAKNFLINESIHEIFGLDANHNIGIIEYTKWDQEYAALSGGGGKTRLPAKYPDIKIKRMANEMISINDQRTNDANPIVTVFNYKGRNVSLGGGPQTNSGASQMMKALDI